MMRANDNRADSDCPNGWEAIYRSGSQLNLYPYDQVVSWFGARFKTPAARAAIRVLDLGCGAGNHLCFLARSGFRCAGIDISATAIEFARNRLKDEGLVADLEVGDFTCLPFASASFDIVLDRGSLAAVDYQRAVAALEEVRRVLAPGGILLFTPFAVGTRIDGPKRHLIGHFWSRADVESALQAPAWRIVQWQRTEKREECGAGDVRIEWWIEAMRGDDPA